MARFRRRVRKRNPRVKQTSFPKTVASIARKGYKIAKFVHSLVNTEFKFYDVNAASAPTNAVNQSLIWLSNPAVGTAPNQRIGQSVLSKSIFGRLNVTMHASATTTFIRCVLLLDTKTSELSSGPIVGDVLATSATADETIAPLSMENPGRFQILQEKFIKLSINGPRCDQWKIKYNFTDKDQGMQHAKWDLSGSAFGDARSGHLYLLLVSDQATNTPAVQYYTRYRFIDN